MLRSILAVVVGVILAGVVVLAVESIGHIVYPPPADLDASNPEALKAYVAHAPIGVLLFVLLAWAAGSFVGGWSAARIARRAPSFHAMIVGSLVLLSGIATMLMIPHPLWFWIAGILAIVPVSFISSLLVTRRIGVTA